MRKIIVLLCIAMSIVNCVDTKKDKTMAKDVIESKSLEKKENIYQFSVKDLSGNDFKFSDLKGKKIMVVNTASKCGLTPQYKQLQSIYDTYKDKEFIVVGFPANDFMEQEPGNNLTIAAFCKENYGVTFPMMDKITVKGNSMHDVYRFLTQKAKNGLQDSEVAWNFQKYLLDDKGELVKVISPKMLPNDPSIIDWIEGK